MKKLVSIILALVMVCCLGACGKKTEDETIKNVAEDVVESEENIEPAVDKETLYLAFGKALWDVYQQGILPDGRALDYTGTAGAMSNNFAVTDIDGDGQEELILEWTNACMAGMGVHIFDYRDGELCEEFVEFPLIRVYDNGIIEADWSHNQGLAGAFWPFSVYCYDAESDTYPKIGSVDAWDMSVRVTNFEGEPFPVDIDADGDGLIYYIFSADWNGDYDAVPLVDGAEYEKWRNTYLDGAEEIEINYQKLTEENIAALGYPKPEIEVPEPVG